MTFDVPTPVSILLVEDSEDDAFFFCHALQATRLAANVTHLPGGAEAIDFFKELQQGEKPRPDHIFLDLKLPVYSGFDILQWLRERSMLQSLRISILSGSDHPSDLSTARDFGITDYLVKPLSPDDLKRRLGAGGKGIGSSSSASVQTS